MANIEQLQECVGKTVYFRTDGNDVVAGTLEELICFKTKYGIVESIMYGTLNVLAENIFATQDDLLKDNYERAIEKVKAGTNHASRVHRFVKNTKTVDQLVDLYHDYQAIRDALSEISVDLLGQCVDFDECC